jgi:outer membrane protein assembly factor BamB
MASSHQLYLAGKQMACTMGCLVCMVLTTMAADWPQYRGPNHDGVSTDRIKTDWSGSVTNPVWLVPSSNAFNSVCSFAVSGGRAFTQAHRIIGGQDKEVCIALSITNGAELWSSAVLDDAVYTGGVGYDDGPRSTPTVDNGAVYVLTSYLKLYKLNATNGAIIWQKDLIAIYGGSVIGWQNAASPLLENGLIYVNANCDSQNLMALQTSDGEPAWRSQDEEWMTHSTPVLATIHGVRQVIFATQNGLVSLDPLLGDLLWRFVYPFNYSTSLGASPVAYDDMVFVTGAHAYGMGSVVVRVDLTNNAFVPTKLWFTNNPASHWMTPVVYQGFIYGQFGFQQSDANTTTPLKCVEMRTGAVKWSVNNFGHGGVLLVNNYLLAITEIGELVLAQPNTNAYTELGRFLAIPNYFGDTNKCWNSPAVADGRVYVRSTSFGACYDLSTPPSLKLDPPRRTPANKFQLTVRTIDGTPIDSDRLTAMEVHAGTNLAQSPSAWPKITNSLILSNGVANVTNIDGSLSPTRFFIISEPN